MTVWRTSGLLVTLALLQPVAARAEDAAAGGFSFFASLVQMVAALSVVVGLILLVYFASNRLARRIPSLGVGKRYIRVVEVQAVGPRKALMLVEVGGEYLLLANSGDQLSLIKQIDMLEEVELVDDTQNSPSFLAMLKRAGLKG